MAGTSPATHEIFILSNASALRRRVAALAAAAVITPLHELRRVNAAPSRPPVATFVLTAFILTTLVLAALRRVPVFGATTGMRALRTRRVRVAGGPIIAMTMAVGALLATIAFVRLAVAAVRPAGLAAVRLPFLPFALGARSDAKHGIPDHDGIVRLTMTAGVRRTLGRRVRAVAARMLTVGPAVLLVASITAMTALTTTIVVLAAFAA